MGYKETYKEDWNKKKYGILQSRTFCKKICGERGQQLWLSNTVSTRAANRRGVPEG